MIVGALPLSEHLRDTTDLSLCRGSMRKCGWRRGESAAGRAAPRHFTLPDVSLQWLSA
jgi:hypothetical protein